MLPRNDLPQLGRAIMKTLIMLRMVYGYAVVKQDW